ncbi:molybdopterin dinucleotide binding domain-containing protein [Nonomuraea sp. NPDC049158]|uniref:molybdopterin dinucleotide binding domain-containing protein n=1 Tax=Nonomuraea sp. NPDC049158 TaxID=3155649 RepID=UPI00340B8C3D
MGLDPKNWAGLKPFGLGEQKPNNYLEIWKAVRENRGQRRYAWRILRDGACDGCALTTELAARTRPEISEHVRYSGTPQIREDIARSVPVYAGIENLKSKGDHLQYGGPLLCAGWKFPTPDGRARFSVVEVPPLNRPDGTFMVTTRRGKQFNSMVYEKRDALTGATREAVLMNPIDADRLGLKDGDPVRLKSDTGELTGRVVRAPVTPGNLQVHWPEGEVLIDRNKRSPQAGIPDYNAVVTVN